MAVNLSPFGGVGAQFLDNAGNVLTGGKIFTYAAGTTTNQAVYTTSAGNVFHTNPIILDASGRVPSGGEIWLTDGLAYKFLLETSTGVLIATYDNIIGINSNFVNFVNEQEIQTATAGQTVFTLATTNYAPNTNSLSVFVDGVNQYGPGAQYAYVETNSTTVTFVNGLHVGALVKFTTSQLNSSGATDASQVTYDPPFTNSAATNVELKLAQTISVKDFGAVGDGVTDDTVAIQNAMIKGGRIYFPEGTYLTDTIRIDSANDGSVIFGDGKYSIIKPKAIATYGIQIEGTAGVGYVTKFAARDLAIDMSLMTDVVATAGIYQRRAYGGVVDNLFIYGWGSNNRAILIKEGSYTTTYSNSTVGANGSKIELTGLSAGDQVTTINFFDIDGDAMIMHLAAHINCYGVVLQGSQTHFQLDQVRELVVHGSDIEGAGNYMSTTANTISVFSFGNSFSGSSGTYRPSPLPNTNYVFMDGPKQFILRDASNYFSVNNTGGGDLRIAGASTGSTAKLEVLTPVSQANTAYQGYFHNDYFGTDANGLRTGVTKNGRDAAALRVDGGGTNSQLQILGNGIWLINEPNNFDIGSVNPGAGSVYFWYDDAAKRFKYKDSLGVTRTITAT